MLSMTGYGSARVALSALAVTVEVRAVNHRFFDVRARLPGGLLDCTAQVEEIAKKALERGRVEISGRIEGVRSGGVVLDRERAASAFAQLQALRDSLAPTEPVPLSLLMAVPDLFVPGESGADEALRDAFAQATRAACDAVAAMRRSEGDALAFDLATRVARVQALANEIGVQIEDLVERLRMRLRTRIASLLEGTGASLDPARLEQEIALQADRADVSEELTRLRSHCEQFAALLGPGTQAVGRRLEFLLQEIGREVNTLGSKLTETAVTRSVVELKAELERMREQAQNVL